MEDNLVDGFTALLIQGNSAALNMAKSVITNPMLINTDPEQGTPWAVMLEVEDHDKGLDAEVSESLVITKNGKKNVADNVAPGSWTWQLAGYIPGIPEMQLTNLFTPYVRVQTDYLTRAAENGHVLLYKDLDNKVYKYVTIKSIHVKTQKDCRNKTPFSLTLKEINLLDEQEANNNVVLSGLAYSVSAQGTTIALNVAKDIVNETLQFAGDIAGQLNRSF